MDDAAAPQDDSCKIFVGAMPRTATEEKVQQLLSQYGPIKDLIMKYDEAGQCKGYCFCEFESPISVEMAISNKEGNHIDGKQVDIQADRGKGKGKDGKGKGKGKKGLDSNLVASQTDPKIFVGNLPRDCTEDIVRAYFMQHGNILEVKMPTREDGSLKGFCFITFDSMDAVHTIYANYAENSLGGQWVDCKPAGPPQRKAGSWGESRGEGWSGHSSWEASGSSWDAGASWGEKSWDAGYAASKGASAAPPGKGGGKQMMQMMTSMMQMMNAWSGGDWASSDSGWDGSWAGSKGSSWGPY